MLLQASRDAADWVLFGAQIAGLVVALVALRISVSQVKEARKEANKAHVAQRKERRIDFELTVLRELLIAANENNALRARALASTLSESVVPITRAAAELPTPSSPGATRLRARSRSEAIAPWWFASRLSRNASDRSGRVRHAPAH